MYTISVYFIDQNNKTIWKGITNIGGIKPKMRIDSNQEKDKYVLKIKKFTFNFSILSYLKNIFYTNMFFFKKKTYFIYI